MAMRHVNSEFAVYQSFGLASPKISSRERKLILHANRDWRESAAVPMRACGVCTKPSILSRMRVSHEKSKIGVLLCRGCFRSGVTTAKINLAAGYNLPPDKIDAIHKVYNSASQRMEKEKHWPDGKMVTFDYVVRLWERQSGRCAISGRIMGAKGGRTGYMISDLHKGSLDRIDSRLGYVEGNVQWTCWGANLMKHMMDIDVLESWCRDIVAHAERQRRRKTKKSLLSRWSQCSFSIY